MSNLIIRYLGKNRPVIDTLCKNGDVWSGSNL